MLYTMQFLVCITMTLSTYLQDILVISIFTASFAILRVAVAVFRVIYTHGRDLVSHRYILMDLLWSTLFLVPVLLVPILKQSVPKGWELKGMDSNLTF